MNETIVKYWGEYDSSVIFCEDKYIQSPYIAEFYNTISGLSYLLVGLYYLNTSIYKTSITQISLYRNYDVTRNFTMVWSISR